MGAVEFSLVPVADAQSLNWVLPLAEVGLYEPR